MNHPFQVKIETGYKEGTTYSVFATDKKAAYRHVANLFPANKQPMMSATQIVPIVGTPFK